MKSFPTTVRQIVYAKRPTGVPTEDCFDLVSTTLAGPVPGQVVVCNYYLSVDPYIRMRMEEKDSYAPVMKIGEILVGRTVGQIVESQAAGFAAGDWVVGRLGWQEYSVAAAADLQKIDVSTAPASAYLSVLGSTGITAWAGLMQVGQPVAGNTVLVSAASGAVGSVVGQLARMHGCRAVGIAGGAVKCAVVKEEFGFDACVDYKSAGFAAELAAAVPGGVDVYFDNVGGQVLDTVLPLLNVGARIPLCGMVSQYNATEPYGVRNLREIFNKRATLRGFLFSEFKSQWPAAMAELTAGYADGRIRYRESIVDGLENAPRAFIDMLGGSNIGKQLVRVRSGA